MTFLEQIQANNSPDNPARIAARATLASTEAECTGCYNCQPNAVTPAGNVKFTATGHNLPWVKGC